MNESNQPSSCSLLNELPQDSGKRERRVPVWFEDWQCTWLRKQDGSPVGTSIRGVPSGERDPQALPSQHLKANLERITHSIQTAIQVLPRIGPSSFKFRSTPCRPTPCRHSFALLAAVLRISLCERTLEIPTRETHQRQYLPVQTSIQSARSLNDSSSCFPTCADRVMV